MDYILRKSYLSNKLPRPLPPPGPERASNLAWMGLQNNLHISPTIVSNSTKHFNGCGSPSRENKQKCSKMTVSNPRVWNTARNTLLTSSFSQDQFHRIVFISTSLHVNRPESGSNFTNPKKVARGQEPEGEAADRVPGGSRGQPWIGWPGKEEGFVLQFRACGAEGGNRQSRPSHGTGDHPRALRLRSPSSRTQDSGLNAEGLGNSHLTENRVPRLPGNRPRCSSLLRADRPPRPQVTPASRPPLGASISHPLLTSRHSDPARWACEYSHPHSLGSLWPFLAAPAKFSLRPPSSPCSRLRDCSIGRAWLCRAARRQRLTGGLSQWQKELYFGLNHSATGRGRNCRPLWLWANEKWGRGPLPPQLAAGGWAPLLAQSRGGFEYLGLRRRGFAAQLFWCGERGLPGPFNL